jgi:F0F1-type ATP synthase membrane subunit b/b'
MESLLKMFSLTVQDAQMIPFGALFFIVLWLSLSRFVFKPYLALIEARERATSGAVDSIREKLARAAELRQGVEQKIGTERFAAVKQKLETISVAKQSATRVVEEAEIAAQTTLKEGRAQIARDVETVRTRTIGEADGLAEMIVQKLTGGSAASMGRDDV